MMPLSYAAGIIPELHDCLFQKQFSVIVGADEAGRGSCAGPLVIAACAIEHTQLTNHEFISQIRDSKKINPTRRAYLYDHILNWCHDYSIITISSAEIDRMGVHRANISGLRRAINELSRTAEYALIDGFEVPGLTIPSLAITKGDTYGLPIAAASVLAKVYRDRLMYDLDSQYPEYGFAQHKGYCTQFHQLALEKHGVSPIHRISYANVATILASRNSSSSRVKD